MSVKLVITDPHTHGPIELRALAHYFNCLAADVSGQKVGGTSVAGTGGAGFMMHGGASGGTGNPPSGSKVLAPSDMTEREHFQTCLDAGTVTTELHNIGPVNDPIDPACHVEQPAEVFGGKSSEATDPVTPASDAPESDAASSTAASSTASPSPDAVQGVQVDKRGLPWDARIHASSKAINQTDGLWRAKRGIDPAIVPGVEEELRALMAIPVSDAPADDDLPPPIPDEDDDVPPPIPEDEPTGVPTNLGELMLLATAAVAAKRMQMTELTAAAKELGVAGLPLLGARPDLVAKVYEILKDKLV